jgi:hypothetical protein
MPIERSVQRNVDEAVRKNVGLYLRDHMKLTDSVVLEPVGYIGYFAGDVTTIDYPGLTSKIATKALRRLPASRRSVAALVVATKPEWAVLRPDEWIQFQGLDPSLAASYALLKTIVAPHGTTLEFGGMSYRSVDKTFLILRRCASRSACVRKATTAAVSAAA